jgi:hypothetical protein
MSEVKVEITANSSALATGLAKAQKNIQNFGKDVTSNITDKLAGAFTGGAVMAGIGALAAGVLVAGKSIMDFAGNLQDSADAMGVTVEQLQGLRAAFLGGGASAEDVDKGISKLLQNMDTATNSVGPIRDAFDKLGVSFETLSSGDPNAVILAIADGVKNAKNPTEAYAAALDLLGKSGKKMMAGLIEGGAALDEISKKSEKLGGQDAAIIAKFGDAVDVLTSKLGALGAKAATPIFGELNAAMDDTQPKMERFARLASILQSSTTVGGFIANAVSGVFGGKKAEAPKPEDFLGPTMAELTAPVIIDPKIKAAEEAQAKMDDENQKKADAYAEKKLAEANKIADVEMSNAQEIEKQRRDQLDTEGQINALLEDRKNLQSEIASSSGMQKAQAQKDLIAVEKDLATAKDKAKKDMAAEGDEREKNNAADMKKKEDAAKNAANKKKDLAEADVNRVAELAAQKKSGEERRSSILDQMVDEEMKTPMQRANEDRVARERERIKGSLERRMKNLRPRQSAQMAKLSGELMELTDKELPAEVKALTKKLDEVVNKINKG